MRRFVIVAALVAATFLSTACAHAQPSGPVNVGTLLKQLYGLQNAPDCHPSSVAVGAGSVTRVLPNKASRAAICFFNPGLVDVWIWVDATVSTTFGQHLPAGGGFACYNFREDMLLPTSEWFAVTALSAATLSTLECDVQ